MGLKEKKENLSDEQLVVLARDKDKEYFSFLVNRYESKIKRYLNRLTNYSAEAEDLLQQTFLNVYTNLYGFNPQKRFSPWIYRIAHNLAINWLKKKKAGISIDENEFIAARLSAEVDVFDEIITQEEKKDLSLAINKLPDKFKEPLILYYLEEKSYEEISHILRKPKNSVGTLLNRAKKILKKELIKNYGKPE